MKSSSDHNKPNVLDYDNYRLFIHDFMKFQKSINPKYSYRLFAREAKLKTHSYILKIIQGDLNINEEHLQGYIDALKLETEKEKLHFKFLVITNNKETTQIAVRDNNPFDDVIKLILIGLAKFKNFKADSNWIYHQLHCTISEKNIQRNLEQLLDLGTIVKQGEKWDIDQSGSRHFLYELRTENFIEIHKFLESCLTRSEIPTKLGIQVFHGDQNAQQDLAQAIDSKLMGFSADLRNKKISKKSTYMFYYNIAKLAEESEENE